MGADKHFSITKGLVAQLGERCVRNAEVGSSTLLGSIMSTGSGIAYRSCAHKNIRRDRSCGCFFILFADREDRICCSTTQVYPCGKEAYAAA